MPPIKVIPKEGLRFPDQIVRLEVAGSDDDTWRLLTSVELTGLTELVLRQPYSPPDHDYSPDDLSAPSLKKLTYEMSQSVPVLRTYRSLVVLRLDSYAYDHPINLANFPVLEELYLNEIYAHPVDLAPAKSLRVASFGTPGGTYKRKGFNALITFGHLPSLEVLLLDSYYPFEVDARSFPNLKKLRLSKLGRGSGRPGHDFDFSPLTRLEELDLNHYEGELGRVDSLLRLKSIYRKRAIDFNNYPRLAELDLGESVPPCVPTEITKATLRTHLPINFGLFPKLEWLWLTEYRYPLDFRHLASLRKLTLDSFEGTLDLSGAKLESLIIGYAPNGPLDLTCLAGTLRHLAVWSSTRRPIDLEGLINLEEIDLTGLEEGFSLGDHPKLRRLRLGLDSPEVDLRGYPLLEELSPPSAFLNAVFGDHPRLRLEGRPYREAMARWDDSSDDSSEESDSSEGVDHWI